MAGIEWQAITPEEMIRDIENVVQQNRENKYVFQVGIKDLDFDIDEDRRKAIGIHLPFQSIDRAEHALRLGVIAPSTFLEVDDTEHQVLVFDHRPIAYSGFRDCVTHSLALTNRGLFEVGRYPAMNLSSQNRYWQWFLHRRLATVEEVAVWQESQCLPSNQFMENVYRAFIQG